MASTKRKVSSDSCETDLLEWRRKFNAATSEGDLNTFKRVWASFVKTSHHVANTELLKAMVLVGTSILEMQDVEPTTTTTSTTTKTKKPKKESKSDDVDKGNEEKAETKKEENDDDEEDNEDDEPEVKEDKRGYPLICDTCGSNGSGVRSTHRNSGHPNAPICLISHDPERSAAYWCKRCCDSGIFDKKKTPTCDCMDWACENGTDPEKTEMQKKRALLKAGSDA